MPFYEKKLTIPRAVGVFLAVFIITLYTYLLYQVYASSHFLTTLFLMAFPLIAVYAWLLVGGQRQPQPTKNRVPLYNKPDMPGKNN